MIKIPHKQKILNVLLSIILMPEAQSIAHASVFDGSENPLINAAPKTLNLQRLSSSAYPNEAELFCSTEQCVFGLTRNLVVGGDAVGMIAAPLRPAFDPNWVSGGSTYLIDAFGGFQILKDVNGSNMNAQIGYRKLYFSDGFNQIYTQGLTAKISYSLNATPIYSQGFQFSGYFVFGNAFLNNTAALDVNSSGHPQLNTTASYFYRLSQNYPTYRLSLPADVEVVNWASSQTGLPMPLRIYAHLEPFYIQNNLNFTGNNLSLQQQEQNFGMRLAGIASYESSNDDRAYHYGLKAAAGMDIASSQFTTISAGNTNLSLPNRPLVAPYIEIAAIFQF